MNVKELIAALQALGPEYEESMIVVDEPGMGGPGEAKRLITVPEISGLWEFNSFDRFEKVVYIDNSACSGVSKQAEEEGWKVPYCNPILRTPLPPKPPEIIVRQPICRECLKAALPLRGLQKLVPYRTDTCAVCEEQVEVVATI